MMPIQSINEYLEASRKNNSYYGEALSNFIFLMIMF